MRKTARERAFQLVFEYLFLHEPQEIESSELLAAADLDESDLEYVRRVYAGVTEKFEELSGEIAACSEGYSASRIFRVDFAILLVALYEIRYMPDIPSSVSVNEAVELSKSYSTEKSGSYINGVLGGAIKRLTEEE